MFVDHFSKRERYLAIAAALAVLTAAVYALIVRPLSVKWKNLNTQIRSKVNMLEKDSKILSNQARLEAEYAKLSKNARSSKSEEQAVSDTLAYIEDISRKDSCLIINIKPIGIKDTPTHKEIMIDLSCEAPIEQLSKFLYDIENPRDALLNIKSLSISAKSGQTSTLKATLLISRILLD